MIMYLLVVMSVIITNDVVATSPVSVSGHTPTASTAMRVLEVSSCRHQSWHHHTSDNIWRSWETSSLCSSPSAWTSWGPPTLSRWSGWRRWRAPRAGWPPPWEWRRTNTGRCQTSSRLSLAEFWASGEESAPWAQSSSWWWWPRGTAAGGGWTRRRQVTTHTNNLQITCPGLWVETIKYLLTLVLTLWQPQKLRNWCKIFTSLFTFTIYI